jgi:hypothetical protein
MYMGRISRQVLAPDWPGWYMFPAVRSGFDLLMYVGRITRFAVVRGDPGRHLMPPLDTVTWCPLFARGRTFKR